MGTLDLILIGGVAWVAILGLFVSFAAVASRSDAQYDEFVGLKARDASPASGPRRVPARSGVKLSA